MASVGMDSEPPRRLTALLSRADGCRPDRNRPGGGSCAIRPQVPPERPDPAIYSQPQLLAQGNPASWDSPDILTNWWSPWRLMEETKVKVRNLSPTAAASNVLVHLLRSGFGIGLPRTSELTMTISLAPGQTTQLLFPLPQAVLSGDPRTAVHIEIEHPTDRDPGNNRGSQVVFGVLTSVDGRNFDLSFPVRNPSATAQQITLSLLANDLGASVTPGTRVFAPLEQIQAQVHFAVPSFLHGSPGASIDREVTVVGRGSNGALIDGITYIARIDD
jgi:hypothetical protein